MKLVHRFFPVLTCLSVTCIVASFTVETASAQTVVNFTKDKLTSEFVIPPEQSSLKGGGSRDKKWLMVDFEYTVESDKAFVDEIQFKVYIEGTEFANPSDKSDKGTAIVLTGETTYVNIPEGKSAGGGMAYGSFYVHPNTIARYGGEKEFTKRYNVHVDAIVGGQVVGGTDRLVDKDPKWYSTLKPMPNLVYTREGSPFLLSDQGRYPAAKLKSGGN